MPTDDELKTYIEVRLHFQLTNKILILLECHIYRD